MRQEPLLEEALKSFLGIVGEKMGSNLHYLLKLFIYTVKKRDVLKAPG
jgi:hypothetical protein